MNQPEQKSEIGHGICVIITHEVGVRKRIFHSFHQVNSSVGNQGTSVTIWAVNILMLDTNLFQLHWTKKFRILSLMT